MTYMTESAIELNLTSSGSGHVFVSGSWHIGELRFSFDELSEYLSVNDYEQVDPLSEDSWCYACHRDIEEFDIELYEIPFRVSTHNPIVCNDCRDTLIESLQSFVGNNVCEISIRSL